MKKYTKRYISVFMRAATLLVPDLANNENEEIRRKNEDVCQRFAIEMIQRYNKNGIVVIAEPFLYTNDMGVKKTTPIGNFIAEHNLDIGAREIIISQKGIKYSKTYHVPPCWEEGIAYNLPRIIEIN